MKTCSKCGVAKDDSCFYARGLECRECTCARVRAYRKANADYYYDYVATRPKKPRKPMPNEQARANSARWYAANKHKALAHDRVLKAIASGKIVRPDTCQKCGSGGPRIEAHHPDYSKPLDVIWLCDPCHSATHRKRPVPTNFVPRKTKWRTKDGGAA